MTSCHCSDAHSYAISNDKDRLGNCFTWIKADTTFAGLKHALREPTERIFVGDLPPKLSVVAQNKTKYIHEVRISKTEGSPLQEVWFDQISVPFNCDLVAIIGNKGTGKSALADILSLLGNSKRDKYFSFLNDEKFRDLKANKAKYFEATVEFEAGSPLPFHRVLPLPRALDSHYQLVQLEGVTPTRPKESFLFN